MALEKTTYTSGDTLTAEKVNAIQDEIIANGNSIITLNNDITENGDNFDKHYHRYNFSTKKWIAYGDSITDADYSSTTKYVSLLGDYFNFASVSNYGLASSNIAHVTDETVQCGVDIYNAHKTETADLITIFYGTNDWYNNIDVGTYSDTGTETLFGAFNTIIKDIKTRQPDCEIIIITPIWRDYASATTGGTLPYSQNGNGITFESYVKEIEKIANFHGVQCVNLYELLGVRQYSISDTTPLHYTKDSLHPDQTGQYRIANILKPLIEQRVLLNSNPNSIYENISIKGEQDLPTRITSISDLVDMTKGQTLSLDTTNNQPVKAEGNDKIVVFKETALNFIITTSANATLFFNLWANGNTGYGFAFNKNTSYKGLCFTCNFSTGVTSAYDTYATNKTEWADINTGVNKLHILYDTSAAAWKIHTVSNNVETLAATVTKSNFTGTTITAATPLFAVASCYDARPFTLVQ